MIWESCTLLAREQTGEDALGNPLYDFKNVKQVDVRHTPWTDDQIAVEAREVTRNEQQYLLPIPLKDLPDFQKVILNGHTLDITQRIDLSPRWTMIRVKIYKR